MNTATQDTSEVTDYTIKNTYWMVGLGLLAVRIIQGFIYWGGGSRRFIYAPDKLNPDAPHWMAYKFQTAMPGALLGLEHVISFMLQHFWLLYAGVILFSAAELIAGLFLMLGLFTRISALLSMLFSVLLMLMFGWQGATCIDEWTMAACNLAMGTTIFLCGSHVYALDNIFLKKKPHLTSSRVFKWCCGSLPLPLSSGAYKKVALGLLAFVVIFDVGTYSYYRGSVVTPYHHGPVSPTTHHVTLTDGKLLPDGRVSVHAYLDAGTPEAPEHIMEAWLKTRSGETLVHWNTTMLSALPQDSFRNDYDYNQFGAGHYGIQAIVGSAATIILPVSELKDGLDSLPDEGLTLAFKDMEGRTFITSLSRVSE
ncbi:DoxX family membrane protein [Salmonella enterica]|nr:DoxX family membrane protein [Salmonella enterica]ECX5291140.1 DoxX family membrane protein [Salmonella enterica]EGC6171648.1 DoxX family membrane protein [Salmonella enterica]EIF0470876.1 DoxX family membrane protein [Salmonella enterica]